MKPILAIEEKTSIVLTSTNALGYALPPYLPFFQQNPIAGKSDETVQDAGTVNTLKSQQQDLGSAVFVWPMALWTDEESEQSAFELPFDPIISVSGSNAVVKRNVAKKVGGGTIKEFWATDDYSISISGAITTEVQADCDAIVWKIRQLCTEGRTGLNVACAGLNDAYDIYRVVVDTFEFPFTPGIGNQDVVINCVSDEVHDLLIATSNV